MKDLITIGLDLSLAKTGVNILKNKDVIYSGIIKSKPTDRTPMGETKRLMDITDDVFTLIENKLWTLEPDLVLIEGIAFMARNSTALSQLSGLSYLIRAELILNDWPFTIIAPTTLKKFITGSGKADKDVMMMKVYKDYGLEYSDNNESDAFGLSACGMAVLGNPLKKITKPQEEVIELLKKQHEKNKHKCKKNRI